MQRKRSMSDVDIPLTPSASASLTSSRGRVVKPKLWDDGTEAPLALGTAAKLERGGSLPSGGAAAVAAGMPSPPNEDPDDHDSDQPSSASDRPSRRARLPSSGRAESACRSGHLCTTCGCIADVTGNMW